jgi:tetratricopeptide (TPR) repeat protein
MPDSFHLPLEVQPHLAVTADRFPEMQPIEGPPGLSRIAGTGCMMLGSRGHDPASGTCVKTLFLTVFFLPVLALRAYRVADAPADGWTFLGRVPLSWFARLWNLLLPGTACVAIAVALRPHPAPSPDIQAEQQLAEAERLAGQGDWAGPARLEIEVALGSTSHVAEAEHRLDQLLDQVAAGSEDQAAAVYVQVANFLVRRPGRLKNVFERGRQLAEQKERAEPKFAMRVLDAIAPLAPDAVKLAARQQPILERLVAAEPANQDFACKLAVVYEQLEQPDKCEKLLVPFEKRLGASEGARILGRLMAGRGQLQRAEALWLPYVKPHLEKLRGLMHEEDTLDKLLQTQARDDVKQRRAAGFDFNRFDALDEDGQVKMTLDFMSQRLKQDDSLRAIHEAIRREGRAALAAIDLGMLMMQRARGLPAGQRRLELEQAESIFLAVRGLGSGRQGADLDQAEVCYWLGQQARGKKILNAFLRHQDRKVEALFEVGTVLSRVGAVSEARALAEEAFEKATDRRTRHDAAAVRLAIARDDDDRNTWLRRIAPADSMHSAELSQARATTAMNEGRDDDAMQHLRAAIALYESLPVHSTALTGLARAYYSLHLLTADPQAFALARDRIAYAVALSGGDATILGNAATFALRGALRDILRPSVDLKVIKGELTPEVLMHLYRDRRGRDRQVQELRNHPRWNEAVRQCRRLLVLSPRDPSVPRDLFGLYTMTRNTDGLRQLAEKVRGANLDLESDRQETLDFFRGKLDDKWRATMTARTARGRRTLDAARKVGGITRAIAAIDLLDKMISLEALGMPVDADEIVRIAEEAGLANPSYATRRALEHGLLARAALSLARSDPVFKSWTERSRRSLTDAERIALALEKPGRLRDRALKNADVQRVLDLLGQDLAEWPDSADSWMWAMLQASRPGEAERIARTLPGNEWQRLQEELERYLSPLSASGYLKEYWNLRMAGQNAQARDILRRAAADGVPMPFAVE